jgi:hypothetical protein
MSGRSLGKGRQKSPGAVKSGSGLPRGHGPAGARLRSEADLEVAVEEGAGDEALGAALADVGPLAAVVALVDDEGRALGEGLAAEVAAVGPLPGVGDPVGAQQGLAGEALVADLAGEGLLPGVEARVDLQALERLELLAAVGAQVRPDGPLRAPGSRSATATLLPERRVAVPYVPVDVLQVAPCLLLLRPQKSSLIR